MEFIKCTEKDIDSVADLYSKSVSHLESTVNYPRWTAEYPDRKTVEEAVRNGEQYACIENGRILGAVILSENPNGDYDAGSWSRPLKVGEYMVIHTLAADPSRKHRGIGSYIVERCVETARRQGYAAVRIDVVPDNIPAIRLYEKEGFAYAGTADLSRNIDGIPEFALYELNFPAKRSDCYYDR